MVRKNDLYPGCRVRSLTNSPDGIIGVFAGDCGTVVQVGNSEFVVRWDTYDGHIWWCGFWSVELVDDDCKDECTTDINIGDFLFGVAGNKT